MGALCLACGADGVTAPGEVVSSNGALSMIVPDTIHTLGLYVDVRAVGLAPDSSPAYSLDGAKPVNPSAAAPYNYLRTSDSTFTLFVSQRLAPGPHMLDVSAAGGHVARNFTVIRDSARYTLTALPTLGGATAASDLNQDGVVAGWAWGATGPSHAVTWTGTVLQRLPDSESSRAIGLNDRGAVVGVIQDARMTRPCLRAVIWEKGGEPKLLRAYPGTQTPDTSFVCAGVGLRYGSCPYGYCPSEAQFPVDVNNNGTILVRGYLDIGGVVTNIQGGLPFSWSLNNRDQAIVSMGDALSIGYNDFLTGINISVKRDYLFSGRCARGYTSVSQVNDRSVAVGNVRFCDTRAFSVDSAGKATDLSSITGDLRAIALNNLGDVLLAYNGNFILKGGRLLSIAVTEPGWTNVSVARINDAGVILGSATDASGITRAVLLNPVR